MKGHLSKLECFYKDFVMDESEETWDLLIFGDRGVGKSSFRLKVSFPTVIYKTCHTMFCIHTGIDGAF